MPAKHLLGNLLFSCLALCVLLVAPAAEAAWCTVCNSCGGLCETCGNAVGPDVIVGRLAQDQGLGAEIVNYGAGGGSPATIEAFSVGTTSCNVGNAWLDWLESPNVNHPVIGQNCFRLKNFSGVNRFEQIGQSWLKHGFYALSERACCSSCLATDGSHLGVGCSDPYNASRNGGQFAAGPKYAVNATTGVHYHPSGLPSYSGTVARRLQVKISDLENSDGTGSTKYFVEGQYVAADDAASGNKDNNCSYRILTVSGSGTSWTFGVLGGGPYTDAADQWTRRMKPAIYAWSEYDTGVATVSVVTPEDANVDPDLTVALVIVAAKATDLGGGQWNYEYAVQNVNSDRSIASFSVPITPYASVSNIGFHDVDYHSGDGIGNVTTDGTDWPGVFSPANASVSWAVTQTYGQNVNANALRWGTLYNFRFDANVPPNSVDASITMQQFKPGAQTVTASITVPTTTTSCLRGDINNDGLIDGLDIARFCDIVVTNDVDATPREKCAGDLEASPDFLIDADDVDNFANCLLAGGGC